MPARFNANSTTDDVLEGVELRGKRILVTGVSAGLGLETARALAMHGAHVVGTARDQHKAQQAARSVGLTAGDGLELLDLDLASLASVRNCADALISRSEPFDVVIANAGVMACPFGLTEDGFEIQFGTNHLGHFVLINRIASLLQPGARVVSLASSNHVVDVDLDDPNFERTPYVPFVGYARSKTANILFAVEFDRRHRARGVRATAVHPGAIDTDLGQHAGLTGDGFTRAIDAVNAANDAAGRPPLLVKTVPQGAATTVWAAVVAEADQVGGRYCEDCHVAGLASQDETTPGGVRPHAVDPERAIALWARSEELVGERFPDS